MNIDLVKKRLLEHLREQGLDELSELSWPYCLYTNEDKNRMKKTTLDLLGVFSSQEFQNYFEQNILKPILSRVFQHIYPYLLAFTLLWIVMFLSTVVILIILLRARI